MCLSGWRTFHAVKGTRAKACVVGLSQTYKGGHHAWSRLDKWEHNKRQPRAAAGSQIFYTLQRHHLHTGTLTSTSTVMGADAGCMRSLLQLTENGNWPSCKTRACSGNNGQCYLACQEGGSRR